MNNLLEVINNQPIEDIGERFAYGGEMVLIGMLTVFSVLIVIWVSLIIFKFAFHDLGAKRNAAYAPKAEAPVPQAKVEPATDPGEIVAVIAAAIAAAEADASSSGVKFRVVSFKRK